MSVLIETSFGDIVVDLFYEECPLACTNFLKLCKIKYYHSCLIHTIHRDFIALSGDPDNTGNGGNSIWGVLNGNETQYFKTEYVQSFSHNRPGLLSTANNGKDKNTSTFFITLADGLERLDKKHTIFGEIAEGLDVLLKLNNAYCDENNQPIQVIRIRHTDILYDPFPDPEGLIIPNMSPEPHRLPNGRLDDQETFDKYAGKTEEEIMEEEEIKKQAANEEVLVMLGDIRDKSEAPPENVLFICKLNSITQEEDLELIFSQFGKVIGCEIIKDYVTGDSLCFGFIEFEDRASCERAFLKMDNVLIDDRRVHVDFSQSTSKNTASGPATGKGKSRYGHLARRGKNDKEDFDNKKRFRQDGRIGDRKRPRHNSPDRKERSNYRKDDRRDHRRDERSDRRDNRGYKNRERDRSRDRDTEREYNDKRRDYRDRNRDYRDNYRDSRDRERRRDRR